MVSPLSLLARVTRRAVAAPWTVACSTAALVAVSLALASTLPIRSSLEELLPSDVPSVAQIKELQRRVGGDGNVLVVLESLDGPSGLARAEALAPVLARDLLAMGPAEIRSVEYDMAVTGRWYAAHWPLFASVEDLARARDEVRRRVVQQNPLALDLEDDEGAQLADLNQPLPRERIEQAFASYRDGFMVHPDGASLTIMVRPAGTALGVAEARALLDRMRATVDRHAAALRDGHLRVGFAGTFPLFVAEYEAVVTNVGLTGLITFALVLLSMVLFFRDVRSTITAVACVGAAVAVNFGLTRLTIGHLNSQTAFLGSIIAGDGLNYGLIYLARVRQLRQKGLALPQACEDAARTTAAGTFLASMATSVAFVTLVLAANRGFRHFGIIGGAGMMLSWVATFTLAPALLALFERVRPVRVAAGRPASGRMHALSGWLLARPGLVVTVFSGAVLAAAAVFVLRLPTAMETNLENLGNELRGMHELRRDHDRAQASLGRSIAGSVALVDSREEAQRFCEGVRARMREPRFAEVIQGCETVASVVPDRQQEKLALIHQLRAELTDARLARVEPKLRARLLTVRADLDAQRPVGEEDAPPALLDRFRERDGSVGRLAVITALPEARLELGPNLVAFAAGARGVDVGGRTVDATGENVVFADLLENLEREGPRTTVLSFLGVCAVLLIVLRHRSLGVLVAATLAAGVLLLAGITSAAGLKINFFNFIAYPMTFGIASDFGANIATRVRDRGGRVVTALAEVGPAVAMCAWCTSIGYGSLLLSINRALRSFGWYAILGEATTLASALLMLPALLLLAQRHRRAVAARPIAPLTPHGAPATASASRRPPDAPVS